MSLDRLPFPIACPLHALQTHDPRLGASVLLDNAIFAAYQTMRMAALLMLADYVHTEPDHDPRLPPRIRGLTQPHWQEWSLLADALARFWIAPERSGRMTGRSGSLPDRGLWILPTLARMPGASA